MNLNKLKSNIKYQKVTPRQGLEQSMSQEIRVPERAHQELILNRIQQAICQDHTARGSTDSEKREKRIKGNVNFYFAHMDKLPSLLLAVSLAGIAAAQGKLIKVQYILLQFLCAGTAVAVAGSVSAFSHAAFYKETESMHELGYKFCSCIISVGILYLLAAISVVVIGFEKANSKIVIPASVTTAVLIILTCRLPNDESKTIFSWIFTWIKSKLKKRIEALPVRHTQS